jgi:IS1 family transposase
VESAQNPVEGAGDIWTWAAICADTKLVPSWLVGARDGAAANMFMQDLASRMANRIQLTSDGQRLYLEAVEGAFGAEIDFGMLIKVYGQPRDDAARYSPAECIGTQSRNIQGSPDPTHISTSFVERQNLTMRMGMRRFTRLTNGFSKKAENHAYAVALHYMHYYFGRVHKTLRVTPAMEAGVSDHVWTMEEIAALMDANYTPKPRGPYKKKVQSENSN